MDLIKRKIKVTGDSITIKGLRDYKGIDVEIIVKKYINTRTRKQNNALHLYFSQLAEELNDAGFDMKKVIRKEVDIPWTTLNVKEYLWKPIQKAYLKKESTTKLKTNEIDQVYNILNRMLAEKTKIHVPFPNIELLFDKEDMNQS